MKNFSFGIIGLALGHPLGFAKEIMALGASIDYLVYDKSQKEEQERAETLLKTYSTLKVLANPSELIRQKVDAVLCSSQANRHFELCAEIIKSKIPLFIDKPLAPDYVLAKKIIDLAEEHQAPVMSCSVRRYSENYVSIAGLLNKGKLGQIAFAECFEPHGIPYPGYWQDLIKKSGGLAVNYGIHVIDPLVMLLGYDIESVHAYGSKHIVTELDSEDTAIITMKYKDGRIAVGKVCGAYDYSKMPRVASVGNMVVHGTEAVVETFIDESDVKIYRQGNFGLTPTYFRRAGSPGAIQAFVNMIEDNILPIPYQEMAMVMKILDAARKSIDTGEVIRF